MATTTTRPQALCVCGCAEKWHWPNKETYCLSPDCPCRKFEPAGGDALSDLALYILRFKPTQAEVIPYYADLLRVGHAQDVRWGELNTAIVSRWSLSGLKRIKREAWRLLQ